jgi:phosphoglucosamine mutase
MRCDLGVMISASHNLYEDNGIKLFGPDGFKLSDEIENRIEALMDSDLEAQYARSPDLGRARRVDDVVARYIEYAKRTLPRDVSFEGLRIVVDCANGAGYKAAPEALWELGAEVIKIGVEPNGVNINEGVGSTSPDQLARKVREMRADIGVALDGDADRLIMVDEKGHTIDGDQILAVVAESWRLDGRLSKPGVVATVMSNFGLERHLGGLGLTLERTSVGDRYVLERMVEKGYNVGGEQSGHMILTDYSTTGDGLVAAMQVLAMIKKLGRPASEVCRRFEPLPQLLRNVRFNGGRPLESETVVRAIEAARERLGANGRLVIRASGTEPVIRVMAESEDSALVDTLVSEVCEAVRKAAA